MKKITTIATTVIVTIFLSSTLTAQEIPKTLKQGMPSRFGAMNYLINKLGYNEVETCSGTGIGFCRFSFTNANGQKLAVVTVNNQPGQQPKLQRWWMDTEHSE